MGGGRQDFGHTKATQHSPELTRLALNAQLFSCLSLQTCKDCRHVLLHTSGTSENRCGLFEISSLEVQGTQFTWAVGLIAFQFFSSELNISAKIICSYLFSCVMKVIFLFGVMYVFLDPCLCSKEMKLTLLHTIGYVYVEEGRN